MNEPSVAEARLPSRHTLSAALHVASIVGAGPVPIADIRETYWRRAMGGSPSPVDLQRGEVLLLEVGLLKARGDEFVPSLTLAELVAGDPDDLAAYLCGAVAAAQADSAGGGASLNTLAERLEGLVRDEGLRRTLLLALGRRHDASVTKETGDRGERLVVQTARAELIGLGRRDLAKGVRHLSLISDQLGYDVLAPRTHGPPRLFEVKATTVPSSAQFTFYLSRAEMEAGLRLPEWAIVACAFPHDGSAPGEILGWVPATALEPLLPLDRPGSNWASVKLTLPREALYPGLPSAAN